MHALVLKNYRNLDWCKETCETRKALKNEALFAKIGVDRAEKEPLKWSEIFNTRKMSTVNLTGEKSSGGKLLEESLGMRSALVRTPSRQ